jgi:hypothetical protein
MNNCKTLYSYLIYLNIYVTFLFEQLLLKYCYVISD